MEKHIASNASIALCVFGEKICLVCSLGLVGFARSLMKHTNITLEDEYRSKPSAACRKALNLTRSIENKYARLREIDRLLNNCGIESVSYKNGDLAFSYSNAGDSYATTVVLFASGAFRVTSWGDIVERGSSRYS